jgi:hypothetical protein
LGLRDDRVLDYNFLDYNFVVIKSKNSPNDHNLDIVWAKYVVKCLGNHKPHDKLDNYDYQYRLLSLNHNLRDYD